MFRDGDGLSATLISRSSKVTARGLGGLAWALRKILTARWKTFFPYKFNP